MQKRHFIELADHIRSSHHLRTENAINEIADFCQKQNPMFNRSRWIDYINGKCGPSGGTIKKSK